MPGFSHQSAMATILASKIIGDARVLLQDPTGIRWPDAEMLSWLSAGQREIVSLRPDANALFFQFTPSVNRSWQFIPADGHAFIDAVSNSGNVAAITVVPRHLMDSQLPNWRSATPSTTILHVVFDPRTPKMFWLYPRPASGAQIDLIYSRSPAEIDSLSDVIGLDDIYANPLIDYVCYRAYAKDLETVGNAERAALCRQAFENTLGLKAQADAASRPVERLKN